MGKEGAQGFYKVWVSDAPIEAEAELRRLGVSPRIFRSLLLGRMKFGIIPIVGKIA